MKYAWMAEQKDFPLVRMGEVLGVSVSGYQAWRRDGTGERKWLTDSQMLTLIQAIHAELKGSYGSPRMVKKLRRRGFPASPPRVRQLNA